MRAFFDLLGELLARRPGDLTDWITPWILLLLGGLIVGLALYSWLFAPTL